MSSICPRSPPGPGNLGAGPSFDVQLLHHLTAFWLLFRSRALTPRPFPWVFSAAGLKPARNVVLPQSCWWVSASSPAAQGQTGTLLPPSGMTCFLPCLSPPFLSKTWPWQEQRGRRLLLVGISEIEPSLCGLEDIKPQISYCS